MTVNGEILRAFDNLPEANECELKPKLIYKGSKSSVSILKKSDKWVIISVIAILVNIFFVSLGAFIDSKINHLDAKAQSKFELLISKLDKQATLMQDIGKYSE